ncbi:MAG: IPT/TIG domain-containing protein [Cyclobacteriaceae bacterium]
MKKIIFNYSLTLQLFLMALAMIFITSCEDENEVSGPPVINEVRNYAAAPEDTLITAMNTGQWVIVLGKNFSSGSQVFFNGVPATINNTLFTNTSIVVQVPSIPFHLIPQDAFNVISVSNEKGSSTYTIDIIGEPFISHIRNYADAPNDTIVDAILPGQHINLIGFNLKDATEILFQGIAIDSASAIYTDSSTIVQVPENFSEGNLALKNRISYSTEVASITYTIKIVLPTIEVDPFLELLTGGVGPGKTWVIDFDATGTSTYFLGPMGFSGDELRWDDGCATEGGNCWTWFPEWQSWMPAPADYGSMTFVVGEEGTIVTVNQKVIVGSGDFEGSYALSFEAKTLSFADVVPLNMGWTSAEWSLAHVISLNEDAMRLGFKHKDKAELEIYHYIAQ